MKVKHVLVYDIDYCDHALMYVVIFLYHCDSSSIHNQCNFDQMNLLDTVVKVHVLGLSSCLLTHCHNC